MANISESRIGYIGYLLYVSMGKTVSKKPISLLQIDREIFNKLVTLGSRGRRGAEVFQWLLLRDDFKPFAKSLYDRVTFPNEADESSKKQFITDHFVEGSVNRDIALNGHYILGGVLDEEISRYAIEKVLPLLQKKDLFSDVFIERMITEYVLFGDVNLIGCEIGMVHCTEHRKNAEQTIKPFQPLPSDTELLPRKEIVFDPSEYDENDVLPEEVIFTFGADVTKEDVREFINRNWDAVNLLQRLVINQGALIPKRKIYRQLIQDIWIYNRYLAVLEQRNEEKVVKEIAEDRPTYPQTVVLNEANKMFGGKNKVKSEGSVSTIVARIQRLRDRANA